MAVNFKKNPKREYFESLEPLMTTIEAHSAVLSRGKPQLYEDLRSEGLVFALGRLKHPGYVCKKAIRDKLNERKTQLMSQVTYKKNDNVYGAEQRQFKDNWDESVNDGRRAKTANLATIENNCK